MRNPQKDRVATTISSVGFSATFAAVFAYAFVGSTMLFIAALILGAGTVLTAITLERTTRREVTHEQTAAVAEGIVHPER